jgi:hypothetical protein
LLPVINVGFAVAHRWSKPEAPSLEGAEMARTGPSSGLRLPALERKHEAGRADEEDDESMPGAIARAIPAVTSIQAHRTFGTVERASSQ